MFGSIFCNGPALSQGLIFGRNFAFRKRSGLDMKDWRLANFWSRHHVIEISFFL